MHPLCTFHAAREMLLKVRLLMRLEFSIEVGMQETFELGARHATSKDLIPFSSGSDIRSNPSVREMLHQHHLKRPAQERIPSRFSEAACARGTSGSSPFQPGNRGFRRS